MSFEQGSGNAAADELAVVRRINQFFHAVDRRDYDDVASCLGPKVAFDYSKAGMKFPDNPRALAENIRQRQSVYARVQHLALNPVIDISEDSANVTANFLAFHTLPETPETVCWTLGGRYEFGLSRLEGDWRITSLAQHRVWETGSQVRFMGE